jgi:two-component system sensor histidine kinase/response regulator
MILSKLIAKIAGVYPDYSMEQRALNILNFSVAINCFFGGLFGLVFRMDFSYVSSQIVVSFFVYLLYLFAKKNKNSEIIAVLSVIGILTLFGFTYMTEGGIDGPTFGIATGYFIIFLSLSTKKTYPIFYPFAYVVALITSMTLNYIHPDWAIRYSSIDQRFNDFILNFFQTIIPIYFLFLSNRECYQYEQQQVEEKNKQLAIANATKEKLFAIIGHDLRSPIASLDSLLLMLNEGRISEEELSLHLQQIQNKTGQIRDLLDNLLYWAVSQMEHLQTHPIELSLINIVETELSMLREQAAIKQLKIENNISINAIIVADSEQAKIILRNILTNAVRYTTNGGKITITTAEDKTQQKVIVTNSGKWNEEQTSTDATDPKRTGFGLFLSKDFAKRNGGDLDIDKSSNEIVTVKWTVTKP